MKKLRFLPALLALVLSLCFCLVACGTTDEDEYTPSQLSEQNVYHYLAFNITVSDCIAEYKETSVLDKRVYDLSCIITISTTRAADCYFKGKTTQLENGSTETACPVIIQYSKSVLSQRIGGGWILPDNIYAQIGRDGVSSTSFSIYCTDVSNLSFPTVSIIKSDLTGVILNSAEIVSKIQGIVYCR